MKKIIATALAATMTFSAFAAFAQEEPVVLINEPAAEAVQIQTEKISFGGSVKEIGEDYILVNGETEIRFNLSETTYICDYDLNPVEALKENDNVTVIASAAMTRSIPAQSNAYYILVRTDENAPAPIYAQVASNNGSEIMSSDGNNKIVFDENTPVTANKIRIALKAQDITVGSDIIAFASVVGMSLPAHVPAEKIAVLNLAPVAQESEDEPAAMPEMQSDKLSHNGIVSEIGENFFVIGEDEYQFNTDENTYVCDYDLNPVELKNGDFVTVVSSAQMTMSLPPQSYAHYVLVRTDENAPAPIYAQVASNNGSEIMSSDGNNKIVFDENTPVTANKIRIALKAQDITVGSDIIAFASVVGMSLPAHVPAEKIAVLNLAPVAQEHDVEKITFGGNTYDVAVDYISSELFGETASERLPLRAVCEALGYTVGWNDADKSIVLSKDGKDITLFVGKPIMDGCDEVPVIIEGTTYVTTKIFNVLGGENTNIVDNGNGVLEVR